MLNKLKGLFLEEEGQGMTEYAIVLGVIAVGAIAVLITFGDTITAFITDVTGKITTAITPAP
ncbi:hypothetical protein GCM10011351_15980 [Paraliobacillus quinghaiensis]|uniref:Flp family type IVb pilin n=1 Tax=Paraliobacillus quinghaiensis TaxID=470815 RepID=A0A917WV12_9BACI|nr:Flp family type IVb pilin [Paraliobacillus quinghaiensis]GGM30638.1 hypothetical protein GCM10011351_15980 [Paraliobacillus quinghaiensis]